MSKKGEVIPQHRKTEALILIIGINLIDPLAKLFLLPKGSQDWNARQPVDVLGFVERVGGHDFFLLFQNGLMVDYDMFPAGIGLTVLNQVMPKAITRRNSATFNFDANQNLLLAPAVVLNLSAQRDINFYTGEGISFAPAFTSITQFMVTGGFAGNPIRDYSKLTSSISLSLHYDYIPAMIPEPGYYGQAMGFMSLAVLLASRLRKRTTEG